MARGSQLCLMMVIALYEMWSGDEDMVGNGALCQGLHPEYQWKKKQETPEDPPPHSPQYPQIHKVGM